MSDNKLSDRLKHLEFQWSQTETPKEASNILLHAGREFINNASAIIAALRAAESRPAGTEPQGCPTPGACSCHPDAVAKAVEAEREACAKVAQNRAEGFHTGECERGHVEWDTNAFVCSNRGDCLCVEREEEAEAIATAIRARTTSPSPPFDEAAEREAF